MKIAIVTITDGANYGNRLQNYALQCTLEKLGYEVETIRILSFRELLTVRSIKKKIKNIIKKLTGQNYGHPYLIRRKHFKKFNKQYMHFSKIVLKKNTAPDRLNQKYDYFVAGSDQIWNGRLRIVRENLENYLMTFAEPSKRISYAASFGTNDIEANDNKLFSLELKKYRAISVREESGAEIVRKLTGYISPVVLDPTMLLKREEWDKIVRKPGFIKNEKYILTYFLGSIDERMKLYCAYVAEKLDCRIVNLQNEFIEEESVGDLDVYAVAPDEFLWLAEHSECVLTDSFHGSVFSVVFHKPFFVFGRIATESGNDMSSRIDTLLSKFHLIENKKQLDVFDFEEIPTLCAGDEQDEIAQIERNASLKYLTDALS